MQIPPASIGRHLSSNSVNRIAEPARMEPPAEVKKRQKTFFATLSQSNSLKINNVTHEKHASESH
jgi:hypothetical protein